MMTAHSVSLKIGALTAVSSAMIQSSTTGGAPMLSFLVPLASAVVGAAMSYAVLRSTVARMETDMKDVKADVKACLTKIARIEGRLESE
jgi:hypothetical protein